MCANRSHTIVESVATARRLAFNVVKRLWMNHRASRPCAAVQSGKIGHNLRVRGGRPAKLALLGARLRLGNIVTRDHPRAGDRIFAKFHGCKKSKIAAASQMVKFVIRNPSPHARVVGLAELQITELEVTKLPNQLCPSTRRR